jgi:hypothetical protein
LIKFFLKYGLPYSSLGINSKITSQKSQTMKKLLIVLAIGTFAACNSSSSTTATDTTTTMSADTTMSTMAPDTTSTMSTTDTTKMMADTTHK